MRFGQDSSTILALPTIYYTPPITYIIKRGEDEEEIDISIDLSFILSCRVKLSVLGSAKKGRERRLSRLMPVENEFYASWVSLHKTRPGRKRRTPRSIRGPRRQGGSIEKSE